MRFNLVYLILLSVFFSVRRLSVVVLLLAICAYNRAEWAEEPWLRAGVRVLNGHVFALRVEKMKRAGLVCYRLVVGVLVLASRGEVLMGQRQDTCVHLLILRLPLQTRPPPPFTFHLLPVSGLQLLLLLLSHMYIYVCPFWFNGVRVLCPEPRTPYPPIGGPP